MKALIACTMHIFFYNFFDIADFAEASDLRTSVSKILESHDNDWTSAPFKTTFDPPQDIALLADKVRIHFPADAAQPPSDQVRIFANISGGSEVTDWYMRAFGLVPLPDSAEYAKVGWSEGKARIENNRYLFFQLKYLFLSWILDQDTLQNSSDYQLFIDNLGGRQFGFDRSIYMWYEVDQHIANASRAEKVQKKIQADGSK